jgi:hypothetical protein
MAAAPPTPGPSPPPPPPLLPPEPRWEELRVRVREEDLVPLTFASHRMGKGKHLLMPLFASTRWEGELEPQEGQAVAWVIPDAMLQYKYPPPDAPLLPLVQQAIRDAVAAAAPPPAAPPPAAPPAAAAV